MVSWGDPPTVQWRSLGLGTAVGFSCSDVGGNSTVTVCNAPNPHFFCALSKVEMKNTGTNDVSERGGTCEVAVENSIWKLRAKAGTFTSNDQVLCTALCF